MTPSSPGGVSILRHFIARPQSRGARRPPRLHALGRWETLAILTVLYGIGTFGLLGISPLSPFILKEFGLTRGQVGLLVPALYVGALLFCVPAGRLADRFKPSVCLSSGLGLGGLMLSVAAAAPTFPALLSFLVLAGFGWSIVNPALSRAILVLFVARDRGIAMGVKQMGQTVGGIVAAILLPGVAVWWSWRSVLAMSGVAVVLLVILAWRPLGQVPYQRAVRAVDAAPSDSSWWWLSRPAVLVFLGSGVGLGMAQSALLSYLPLFAIQSLGLSMVAAGGLLGLSQAGGAIGRLALGAVSDRWLHGRRPPCLVVSCWLAAGSFMLFASPLVTSPAVALLGALCAGLGGLGWVGLYMVLAAELGGQRQAGLMSGVSMAFLLVGILMGGPVFGILLDRTDSYSVPWTIFAALCGLVGIAVTITGSAIHRESRATDEEQPSLVRGLMTADASKEVQP